MQTKRVIAALLDEAGLRPLKQYGQHFLIDGNLMRKLVAAAELQPQDVVLEVGPGTGGLTELLLEKAAHVVAVEIDRGLASVCEGRLAGTGRLTLLCRDVLKSKSTIDPDVLNALEAQRRPGGRVVLVSNLPYQVATPLLLDLAMGDLPVSPMCFTVQAEVASRLMAPPGSKDYGPISVLLQSLAVIKRVGSVPPEAFWPAPKVESTMLRVDLCSPNLSHSVRHSLSYVVHGCFQHRRKTLRSGLKYCIDSGLQASIEELARWPLSDRPEQIPVEAWVSLAELIASRRG